MIESKQEHILKNICEFPPAMRTQNTKQKVEVQKKSKDNQLNKNRGTQSLPRIETNRSKQFNTVKSIADSAVGKDDIPSVITSEHDSEADENSSYTKVKRNSSKKKAKKMEKMIPITVNNADVYVDPNRKVIYRKIHKYGKKEFLIEISKTKIKYFIISIRLNKNQKQQVLEYHYKQGKKLIKSAGGIEALADKIKFKYGSLSVQELNKLLYQTKEEEKSYKNFGVNKGPRVHSKKEKDQNLIMFNSEEMDKQPEEDGETEQFEEQHSEVEHILEPEKHHNENFTLETEENQENEENEDEAYKNLSQEHTIQHEDSIEEDEDKHKSEMKNINEMIKSDEGL